jgi:hypothetical protein
MHACTRVPAGVNMLVVTRHGHVHQQGAHASLHLGLYIYICMYMYVYTCFFHSQFLRIPIEMDSHTRTGGGERAVADRGAEGGAAAAWLVPDIRLYARPVWRAAGLRVDVYVYMYCAVVVL